MMKKLVTMIAMIGCMLNGQTTTTTAQEMGYSNINDSRNYTIQTELNKLPKALIEDLSNSGVKIEVDKNLLEDSNFKTDGRYFWTDKRIVLDDAKTSITHALYHEIGHAIDGMFILREDEDIIKSFNDRELEFGNNDYYNGNIKEYVAQGICYYFLGELDDSTTLYSVLDDVLSEYYY